MDLGPLVVVVVVIFGIIRLFRWVEQKWPGLLANWVSGINVRDFSLKLLAISTGVLILDWGIAQTGWFPGMFVGWGWMHLLFYLAAGLGIAIAVSTPGRVGTIAFRLILAAVIVVGTAEAVHSLFGCNEDCKLKKQEAVQVEAQKAAAAAAHEEQNRAVVQAARLEALKPAASAECPGVVSTMPMPLNTEWHVFMQQCDKTWAVVDNTGKQLPDAAVEFDPPYGIPNRVRMKTGSGGLYTMDCPRGFGPSAKVWKCKPQGSYSDTRQAGLTFGVYYK